MKNAGLFLFLSLNVFAFKSDNVILRGRVPASVYVAKLENAEDIKDEKDVLLNVPKHKYQVKVHQEKVYKVIDIIFH